MTVCLSQPMTGQSGTMDLDQYGVRFQEAFEQFWTVAIQSFGLIVWVGVEGITNFGCIP